MSVFETIGKWFLPFVPLVITALSAAIILAGAHWLLLGRHPDLGNERKFPRQLAMLGLTILGVVALALALPVTDSTRNQVIGLVGLVISGMFAFSSTTIMANLMAGVMLRMTRPFRTGDFIRVESYFGRVAERGLLDTEIQDESRELIAIPNREATSARGDRAVGVGDEGRFCRGQGADTIDSRSRSPSPSTTGGFQRHQPLNLSSRRGVESLQSHRSWSCIMSIRAIAVAGLVGAVALSRMASAASLPALKVSDSGRYLVTVDDQPFFWLGDTAWRLIQKASRTDVDDQPSAQRYFEKRSAQGFNVIQTVLVSVDIPANAAGYAPFVDGDFARPRVFPGPDNDFWDDVDWFVDQAAAHGLYLALLPTWNSSVPEDHPMVKDPAVAYRYGHFLGTRYRGRSNFIWVLGGDPPPSRDVGVPQRLAMIRAMAEGLADGANGIDRQDGKADWTSTLMTYHPRGGGQSSSQHLHAEPWLDFNMIQTTTRFQFANYETVAADYALQPPKPTLDAEVAYEASLSLNRKEPQDRRISPWDVRRAAYWSVFAGSFGHTYGHRSFIAWMRKGETFKWGARIPWYESLDAPGANQMCHLRALMESKSLIDHVPDASLLADTGPRGKGHLQATQAGDGSTALVYSPMGKPVPVRLDKFATGSVAASWFDPRTGESTPCGTFESQAKKIFEPPSSGEDHDWILVLTRQ